MMMVVSIKGLITRTEEATQAGMVTYLHEEYNLGICVRGLSGLA